MTQKINIQKFLKEAETDVAIKAYCIAALRCEATKKQLNSLVAEIRANLKQCKNAFPENPDRELFAPYLKTHNNLAGQLSVGLVNLSESPAEAYPVPLVGRGSAIPRQPAQVQLSVPQAPCLQSNNP